MISFLPQDMVLLPEPFTVVSGSFQAGCFKLSSPNLSSEKKDDGREAGKENSLELYLPGWQQSQAWPWSTEVAVRSGHQYILLPPMCYTRQSRGWGKVWVFGGAALLPMSGPFHFSFWTFDQTLIFFGFLLTGL